MSRIYSNEEFKKVFEMDEGLAGSISHEVIRLSSDEFAHLKDYERKQKALLALKRNYDETID